MNCFSDMSNDMNDFLNVCWRFEISLQCIATNCHQSNAYVQAYGEHESSVQTYFIIYFICLVTLAATVLVSFCPFCFEFDPSKFSFYIVSTLLIILKLTCWNKLFFINCWKCFTLIAMSYLSHVLWCIYVICYDCNNCNSVYLFLWFALYTFWTRQYKNKLTMTSCAKRCKTSHKRALRCIHVPEENSITKMNDWQFHRTLLQYL